MGSHPPTPQQAEAVARFTAGGHLVIEAGAGTGKTSTLKLLADAARTQNRKGQYIAFNRAIVDDAALSMPGNVNCATAHGLAWRALGKRYKARLDAGRRIPSARLARLLDIDPIVVDTGHGRKVLAPQFLAGLAVRTVTSFCQSADPAPAPHHVPRIKGIDRAELDPATGRLRLADVAQRAVAAELMPAVGRAWADLQRDDGDLRFEHGHYLKMWQLSGPVIDRDFVLFDEAQDANPVIVAIVAAQTHAQLVWVGDTNQQIYGFTGAINALAQVPHDHVAYLTRSFRFGHGIAGVANRLLADLPTVMALEGNPAIDSTVGPVAEPAAVLTRTNATAVRETIAALADGLKVHLIGGGEEVIRFARAAADLQAGRSTDHPDLACFTTWEEVLAYVDEDELGDELRLLTSLVEDFGVAQILAALENITTDPDRADRTVTTAHKSKGLEWPSVRLASDFADEPDDDELRLLYVAVTRARLELDITDVAVLDDAPPRGAAHQPALEEADA